jgi:hypothetical protein
MTEADNLPFSSTTDDSTTKNQDDNTLPDEWQLPIEQHPDHSAILTKYGLLIQQANAGNNAFLLEKATIQYIPGTQTLLEDLIILKAITNPEAGMLPRCPANCDEKQRTPKQLLTHLYQDHLCQSPPCTQMFDTPMARKDHYRANHESPIALSCKEARWPTICWKPPCSYTTTNYTDFQKHRLTHLTNKVVSAMIYICPIKGCLGNTDDMDSRGFFWTTIGSLKTHYMIHHQQKICPKPWCFYNSHGLADFTQHLRRAHDTPFCPCVDINYPNENPILAHPAGYLAQHECNIFPHITGTNIPELIFKTEDPSFDEHHRVINKLYTHLT